MSTIKHLGVCMNFKSLWYLKEKKTKKCIHSSLAIKVSEIILNKINYHKNILSTFKATFKHLLSNKAQPLCVVSPLEVAVLILWESRLSNPWDAHGKQVSKQLPTMASASAPLKRFIIYFQSIDIFFLH